MYKTIRIFYVVVAAVFMTSTAFAQSTTDAPAKKKPVVAATAAPKAAADTSGTGTAGRVARWIDGAGTLGNSVITDNGTYVGVNNTNPTNQLQVSGSVGGNGPVRIMIDNSNAAGFADIFTFNSAGKYNGLQIGGPSVGGTQFGVPQANLAKFCSSADIFAVGTTVATPLIFGTSDAERIRIDAAGNVGIGTSTPAAKLDVNGDVNVSGNISAKYQDIAEWVPSDSELSAGTVVIVGDGDLDEVHPSETAYDTRVAGVVSPNPGIALGVAAKGKFRIATVGRVKVKVDARKSPIKVGDLLVTSDVAGTAMKSEPIDVSGQKMHRPGTLIGKALEPLAGGVGEIRVLLSLQ